MDKLPLLPGYSFVDPTKTRFHRSQTLNYKNGYCVPDLYPEVGIGGYPLKTHQLTESELGATHDFHPLLTYSRLHPPEVPEAIPTYVTYDKNVLRFYGYFKETVTESPEEHYRVRNVIIYYYLEDDSLHIYEPMQQNSGLHQGWVLKRQRIPKNDYGDHYVWKDLNIGMNLTIYGRVYRITNCDKFTRDFFESEGIELNPIEITPVDPYLRNRAKIKVPECTTKSSFDKRRQYCELDRQVLRFFAVWDDRKELYGDLRKFSILYYLADDTMEVREYHSFNDGRDPYSVLISRHKFPKNRDDVPATFPSVCLELSENEINEYYSPKDFRIGESLVIYGRAFLLYDCDSFTKAWYYQNFGVTDFKSIAIESEDKSKKQQDSQHCDGSESVNKRGESNNRLESKLNRSAMDVQAEYSMKTLRYGAKLASVHPNGTTRKFIISYRLVDDTIQIWEVPVKNSGFAGGLFLRPTRVRKPNGTEEKPEYYSPRDFSIGAVINVFGTRFLLTDVDEYVVKFIEAHRDQFSDNLIANLSSKVVSDMISNTKPKSKPCKYAEQLKFNQRPGAIDNMVEDLTAQLKKLALNDEARLDALFLKYDKDRLCFVDIESLEDICTKMHLPQDKDVLNRFLDKYGTDGRISLDDFRAFFLGRPKPTCLTGVCDRAKPCI